MCKTAFTGLLTFFACLLFVFTTLLQAADLKMITTEELKKKIDAGEPLTLINALSPIEHNEMTIKGSINIPSSKVTADNPLLPADKASLIVFYCKGPKCTKSKNAAKKATELGYKNVLVYNEGIPAWAKKGYPLEKKFEYPKIKCDRLTPQEVQAQAANAVLLDIRGWEVKGLGKISGSTNIPMDDIMDKYTTLPEGKKIIIIDHAGKQVNICSKFLYMKGYKDIDVMEGGIMAWKRAGLPLE